jgi:hypothetical protein
MAMCEQMRMLDVLFVFVDERRGLDVGIKGG